MIKSGDYDEKITKKLSKGLTNRVSKLSDLNN